MFDLLFVPIAVTYLAIVMMLFIYGVNFFYLCYLTWQNRNVGDLHPSLDDLPHVTVQLPIYNELYVAERLINAAARLDYPAHLLEIQVLDDSNDETAELVRSAVDRWRARGVNICHVHRHDRLGFKAGALAHGFEQAHGEFFALFDADFIPATDFLNRTLPHFQNPRVAFVQARWGHVNRDYSFLTFLQSLAIDAHFMVEQFARSHGGYWFNFNGTAGVWRRAALEDAGGWAFDTLTEDLDLSYRAFLRGWQAVYLRGVAVKSELPVNFSAYRRQQHRWARGSLECAIKLLARVWQAPVRLTQKIEATLHLTGYAVHLLMFVLAILYPIVIVMSQRFPGLVSLFGIAAVFNATAFAPALFFALAQQQLGEKWWRALPAILFTAVLGGGMMLNTVRAAWKMVSNPDSVYERTPKFGVRTRNEDWMHRRYQLKLDPIVFVEIAFGFFNLITVFLAIESGNWLIAVYAMLSASGLFFASGMTLAQTLAVNWNREPASMSVIAESTR